MSTVSKYIEPARPIIHKFRSVAYAVFGLSQFVAKVEEARREIAGIKEQLNDFIGNMEGGHRREVEGDLFTLADRIAILESQINWRLYGIPSRIENIKLEQVNILAGAGDVENALELLRRQITPVDFDRLLEGIPKRIEGSAFLFHGDSRKELDLLTERFSGDADLRIFFDSSNLFKTDPSGSGGIEGKCQTIKVSLSNVAACFSRPEYGFIWLSGSLERMTAIQGQILCARVHKGLVDGGICSGFFLDYDECDAGKYWLDPRRLRPITTGFMESLLKS
ncbi:MAG: hypothetical protein HQK54_09520, partial [Oligoflexales bacterium]|nr:hypothetical protein [Oligoflexales bacterium]